MEHLSSLRSYAKEVPSDTPVIQGTVAAIGPFSFSNFASAKLEEAF